MVFEDGFCFLLCASRFAAEWGGFLFIPGCEGRAYLTYVMTTNRHVFPLRHIRGILLSSLLFRIHSLC